MVKTEQSIKYTKFEKARIIGARALQISMGAPFMIKLDDKKLADISYNPIEIAKLEFDEDAIPIAIRRPTPNERLGKVEIEKK